MVVVFNIGIILIVGLIAYWWANQGLFSALLHLLAVIVAGAVALAFWEPLTIGFLLRGGPFDNYAWGVSLVGIFAVALLILRVALDKIVPGNVDLPHWANIVFGLPVGAAAGVLSMGIVVIGCGFVQSHVKLMGFTGMARDPNSGEIAQRSKMWLPVHTLTSDFYGRLSVGALSTARPLRHYSPHLDQQAASLVRDSYGDGEGQLPMPPSAAKITGLKKCETGNRYLVGISFTADARDFGEQLTLSSSQIRLIEMASGSATARTAHPDAWRQKSGYFLFDSVKNYITSVPGQESSDVVVEFPVEADFTPRFVQIRNNRYTLPRAEFFDCSSTGGPIVRTDDDDGTGSPDTTGGSIQAVVQVSNSIRPVQVSTNSMPPGFKTLDLYLSEGEARFAIGQKGRISRELKVKGIYELPGTRVVQLNVSRNGPADIFGGVRRRAQRGATLALVDSNGNTYSPVGYFHTRSDGIYIKLDPYRFLRTTDDLPKLPADGTEELKLLFYVTELSTIVSFEWGDVTVGTCLLTVEPRKKK